MSTAYELGRLFAKQAALDSAAPSTAEPWSSPGRSALAGGLAGATGAALLSVLAGLPGLRRLRAARIGDQQALRQGVEALFGVNQQKMRAALGRLPDRTRSDALAIGRMRSPVAPRLPRPYQEGTLFTPLSAAILGAGVGHERATAGKQAAVRKM